MNADQGEQSLGVVDLALVLLYLIGIYLGVSIAITSRIPFPAAIAGVAGMILFFRRVGALNSTHLAGFLGVFLLFLASIFCADDIHFLGKRFTGLVQLTYSLTISYALFLTVIRARPSQLSGLFLGFCLFILVGCILEDYAGLRAISDKVRLAIYDTGIYDADLRDEILYGRVRPKLFTSEPSAVTFAYTLFAFCWLMTSGWRLRLLGYLGLMGAGMVAMPGPTLLLMLVLLLGYPLLLDIVVRMNGGEGAGFGAFVKLIVLSVILIGGFVYVGSSVYATRLNEIVNGNDPSFFYRVIGPALTALDVIKHHPWAGAGLTGEPFIADEVLNVFVRSPDFSVGWNITRIGDVLTNYFWLHWIYLGVVWGVIMLLAISVWLKLLGTPSAGFCWLIWAVLGQASGAYVGPKTWTVLFLCAACSYLQSRRVAQVPVPRANGDITARLVRRLVANGRHPLPS